MIYRGPGFLAVSKLDRRHTGRLRKRGDGREGEGRANSRDGEKGWSSINQSILSSSIDDSNAHASIVRMTFVFM
jgi:hypothetical protein